MNDAAKFIDAHPPVFTDDELAAITKERFGIAGTIKPLWGERDQNVMVEREQGGDAVLKITNSRESRDTVDLHVATLHRLAEADPDLPVARLIPSVGGDEIITVHGSDGTPHLAYLCSRLPGAPYNSVEVGSQRKQVLHAVGVLAGRTSKALSGFFHPAVGNPLFWDVRHLPQLVDCGAGIRNKSLRTTVDDLCEALLSTLPAKLKTMRAQPIHHDINQANILVDPDDPTGPTGLIDFGDMIHGTIAQDVAVCAAEMAFNSPDVIGDAAAAIAGYDSAFELNEDEIDLLWDLMVARCISGLLICGARNLHGITSSNNFDYEDHYTPILEPLLKAGREQTIETFRHACRFPTYCPPAPENVASIRDDEVSDDLLTRRHSILGRHALLSYDRPLHTVRGEGVWLFDAAGNRFLDAYNNVPHVGHSHPHVVRALSRQARALNTNTRYIYESVLEYGERLAALLPGDLNVTLFVNSGSEANDVAQQMTRKLTGRTGSLIVADAYHGITSEIYTLSPSMDWGHGDAVNARHPSNTRADIGVLPVPDLLRADDPAGTLRECRERSQQIVQDMKAAGYPPSMFMFCSAFSSSGILDLPRAYISDIAEQVQSDGGLIVCDEVQYGFGRSGDEFWGFANYGVTPDAVTLGKPMGNGIAIGAVVTTPDNVERFTKETGFFSTFGGNPVACAAANAVLDVIESENLRENAQDTGAYLRESLRACIASIPGGTDIVADIRGRGLFVGAEIVRNAETLEPDEDACSRIKNHMRNNRVLIGSDGFHRNVLKIRPPMVFTRQHADLFTAAFGEAIEDVIRHRE